jgi:DNA invertase Pin-like site-specific DNA recombinase
MVQSNHVRPIGQRSPDPAVSQVEASRQRAGLNTATVKEIAMSTDNSTALVRGVTYFRVSQAEGARYDGKEHEESITQQNEWAKMAAVREGIEIVAQFNDEGIAGYDNRRRTGFKAMLEFCKKEKRRGQPITAILCYHVNRFSRADGHETGWYIWEFRQAGVDRLLTAQRWFRFDRMEDRIMLGIDQEVNAHKYSIDLAHASTRGKIKTAQNGEFTGGPVPFGYRLRYPDDQRPGRKRRGRLEIEPDEAALVREAFNRYASGQESVWEIIEDFNRRGIVPPSKKRQRRGRQASHWNHRTMCKILSNEMYLGGNVWNRRHEGRFVGVVDLQPVAESGTPRRKNPESAIIRRPDPHTALVDEQTFLTVQRQLEKRKTRTTPIRGGGDFRLTGMIRCGHCGRNMSGRNYPYRGKEAGKPGYRRYVCSSYFAHGKSACNYNAIEEAPLVAGIARLLATRFSPEVIEAVRQQAREIASAVDEQPGEADRLRQRIAELEADLIRAADKLIREEERYLGPVRERMRQLQDERDRLAAKLARVTAREASTEKNDPDALADACVACLQHLDEVMANGNPADVRAALGDLISHVEVFFTHEPAKGGRETRCTFARALVYITSESPLASCLGTVCAACSRIME